MSKRYVEVDSEEDLKEIEDLGTTYRRNTYDAVSTVLGSMDEEVVFVYVKDSEGLRDKLQRLDKVVKAEMRGGSDDE